jgi:hypothetical protein
MSKNYNYALKNVGHEEMSIYALMGTKLNIRPIWLRIKMGHYRYQKILIPSFMIV